MTQILRNCALGFGRNLRKAECAQAFSWVLFMRLVFSISTWIVSAEGGSWWFELMSAFHLKRWPWSWRGVVRTPSLGGRASIRLRLALQWGREAGLSGRLLSSFEGEGCPRARWVCPPHPCPEGWTPRAWAGRWPPLSLGSGSLRST